MISVNKPEENFLLRQIHPDFFPDGRVQSSAFNPTSRHQYRLSTNNNSMISAHEAFSRHLENGGLTIGVLGITEQDCSKNDLTIDHDGLTEQDIPDDHVSVVFPEPIGNAGKRQNKRMAESLRDEAVARDWFYKP